MNLGKKQFLLIIGGLVLIVAIYLLPRKAPDEAELNTTQADEGKELSQEDLPPDLLEASENARKEPSVKNLMIAGTLFHNAMSESNDSMSYTNRAGKAIHYYTMVLEKDSNNLEAKSALGLCIALSTSEPMKGIMMLREVVTKDPNNETGQYYLGVLSMKSGQYQKAIERFERVKLINSKNFNVLLPLAEAYLAIGDSKMAISNLDELEKSGAEALLIEKGAELRRNIENKKK